VLVNIVKAYLQETSPKVAGLLDATETGNVEAALPLVYDLAGASHQHTAVWEGISDFIEDHAMPDEWTRLVKQGHSLEYVYGLIFERVRPGIEAEVAEKEAALDQMLDDYRDLSPALRERANAKMETLQAEVDALRHKVEDLRVPWATFTAELAARKIALANAQKALRKDTSGRQKSEALRTALAEIRCWFRHTATKESKHNGKSYLERVEITPVAGSVYTSFIDGNAPVPG
jgi:hypothetical protein